MFRILSINVNGLRSFSKRAAVFHWINEKKFDCVLLQETHCSNDFEAKQWEKHWGGVGFWNNGTSSSNGVAILLTKEFKDMVRLHDHVKGNVDLKGRLLSLDCNLDDKMYRVTNIYSPNDPSTIIL